MERSTRGLGFRLISVSVAIVAVAALVVAVVVTKLSEDEGKTRLLRQAEELAQLVGGAVAAGGRVEGLDRAVLAAKLREVGTAWVVDREGNLVGDGAAREFVGRERCVPFGDAEIELTTVKQPVAQMGGQKLHKVRLKEVVDRYDAGIGILNCQGTPHLAAFRVLPDQGWIVGVDEPFTADSSSGSLKKYILLTCLVLGVFIILGTVFSISFIIQPFYREKLELSERIEAANHNLKKLHDVSVGMQKSLSLEDRVHTILAAAHEVLGLDRIFLYLANAENTVLECLGAFGNRDEEPSQIVLPLGPAGGVIADAFLKKKTFRVANARDLARDLRLLPPYSEIKALQSRNFVVYPMIVENECLGVVAADNKLSKAPITDEIIEGLELFTSQAAVAIQNAKLYQQLKLYADELEVTDHLTQLFTFFHFKKLLQGEVDRGRVGHGELSLAVLSIENFARYNELLGHKHGDDVLRRVAQVIRNSVRKKEIIGRCFGSTFAVLFPGTAEADAQPLVGEIVQKLRAETYVGQEVLGVDGVQFSLGFAGYRRGEAWSAEDFFSEVHGRSHRVEG
ncbi:MAG: sensor domain-containing diguanylate cyclase [Deferrisomatales bacterium]|nr:sensor domain-containing diguanylate cyclase [Deferrisomatales bacterium]